MKKNFSKITFAFLIVLLIYLPFQVLFQETLQNTWHLGAGLSFWLAHWYEIFILILSGSILYEKIILLTKRPRWQAITLLLLFFGLLSVLFLSRNVSRGVEGYRLDLFFLLMIFIAARLPEKFARQLVQIYLSLSVLVSLWALFERFLPVHYWQKLFNLSADFGYGNYFVGLTPRSDSIFNGPSQLSSYLLPAAGLLLVKISASSKSVWRYYLYYSVVLLGIGFAYSRAAWIGLIVLILLSLVLVVKNWPERVKISLVSLVMILTPLLFVKTISGNLTVAILTHDTSQASHATAATTTLGEMKQRLDKPVKLLFGSGLGSAGPLILKYRDGLIPESWYLQILLELGVVGLALWLWLMAALFLDILKMSAGLSLGLVAVSVTALFLHTFADSPATSWTLFLLIGSSLKGNSNTDLFHG